MRRIADSRPFQPGDIVLLRHKLDHTAPPVLTRPLKPGRRIESHKGTLHHDDIIGKRVRDVVSTAPLRSGKPGGEFRLHEVKLDEYVKLSRRLVTPIYPADANVIVDTLDLHPDVFNPSKAGDEDVKLEILEAGTGHGSLTLYLSRAVHASNPPLPPSDTKQDGETEPVAMAQWKVERRAIIHSVETSAKYSAHAEDIVKGFRGGLYYQNIDFHVTDVSAWTRKALFERNGQPFLSHAFLDLPSADSHLGGVADALRTNGSLVAFNPSITQILECVRKIEEDSLPLELERVIELGLNGSSGGREWNVRAVRPRRKKEPLLPQDTEEGSASDTAGAEVAAEDTVVTDDAAEMATDTEDTPDQPVTNERLSMICRPKVGDRITGGGFLGIWRKQRNMREVK